MHADASAEVVHRARDLQMLSLSPHFKVQNPLTGRRPAQVSKGVPRDLLGREPERAAFQAVLSAVRDGRSATMTVQGGAGSGKTRLAQELAAESTAAGVPVVLAIRLRSGTLQPWQYLAGALWANCCRDFEADPDPLSTGERRVLTEFVGAAPSDRLDDQAPARRRAELVAAICALARQVAARRGLVIAFDDAEQFTDRECELLREVRQRLADVPVGWLLIGQAQGGWHDLPDAGDEEVRFTLSLMPLPAEEVRRWVVETQRREPSAAETAAIWQRTGGLPLNLSGDPAGS